MIEHRIILQTGSGYDPHGEDYTGAACRAVQDALQHSSILLLRSLNIDQRQLRIKVTIGVQAPESIDADAVVTELPADCREVTIAKGGLNVHDPVLGTTQIAATAAIEIFLPIDASAWELIERTHD